MSTKPAKPDKPAKRKRKAKASPPNVTRRTYGVPKELTITLDGLSYEVSVTPVVVTHSDGRADSMEGRISWRDPEDRTPHVVMGASVPLTRRAWLFMDTYVEHHVRAAHRAAHAKFHQYALDEGDNREALRLELDRHERAHQELLRKFLELRELVARIDGRLARICEGSVPQLEE